MLRISRFISYQEATTSQTAVRLGIPNVPDEHTLLRMNYVAENVFDPVRAKIGKPLRVSSFFRSAALNRAIGGAANSQHITGEAIDIQGMGGVSNFRIFRTILDEIHLFDQLISEYPNGKGEPSWVHVSLKMNGHNRKQILVARKVGGKTVYEPYFIV